MASLDGLLRVRVVWDRAVEFAASRGFSRVSFLSQRRGTAPGFDMFASGFDSEWTTRYAAQRLWQIDPFLKQALGSTGPVRWSEIAELRDLSPDEHRFVADAMRLGDGMSIGAFGPNMRQACFGVGFPSGAPPPSPAVVRELQLAAQATLLAVCRIHDERTGFERLRLTRRECDVLDLMARGMENTAIAGSLEISRHTVDALQRRIYQKLDVDDRTSAVVRGLASGFISMPVIGPGQYSRGR
ncbi:hypothetical protein HKCCE3408_10380 [Rhodobacterales bacterium HKCCE3408]|nr:hypothetical protein [Rhodobacterales bacterium HKCCE3408]